ncbi:MAG: hypothetical protein MI861_09165, partial [Pirellulales bacterium]|nr:hypothetical protein [Pirellulales bacterium]
AAADGPQRYLRKAFAFNPMWQSKEFLELRRGKLGLKSVANDLSADEITRRQGRRHAVKQHVKQIQNHFWTMPLDQLQQMLQAIDIEEMPELAPLVKRLRTTATCRADFPRMGAARGMDLSLFNAFRKVVVLPPAEAGYIREQFIQSLHHPSRLRDVRRAIRVIESDYSILFGLERDWFLTLSQLRKSQVVRQNGESGMDVSNVSWFAWIIVFVLLRALLRLVTG